MDPIETSPVFPGSLKAGNLRLSFPPRRQQVHGDFGGTEIYGVTSGTNCNISSSYKELSKLACISFRNNSHRDNVLYDILGQEKNK